jgi:hypothetical protein
MARMQRIFDLVALIKSFVPHDPDEPRLSCKNLNLSHGKQITAQVNHLHCCLFQASIRGIHSDFKGLLIFQTAIGAGYGTTTEGDLENEDSFCLSVH